MNRFRLAGALAGVMLLALSPARSTEQSSYVTPTSGPMSMATFAGTYLNPALRAIASCHNGSSAPANGPSGAPLAYQCWIDTTSNPSLYKIYDGASWVALGSLNTSTHAWIPYLTGGTSGGVPYFASSGVMASSAALAQYGLVIGGGAGAPPSTITAGTDDQIPFGRSSNSPLFRTVTGDVTFSAGVSAVGANKISNAMLRQSGALSLVGRSANTSGNVADIQATAASDCVYRESASSLGCGTIATAGIANNAVTLGKLATQAANTVLANATSGAAVPTAFAMPSCSTSASALNWTSNSGFGCNSAISVAIANVTGLGTGVGAALAINTGSAGAVVLFNGAGGTPSSLTLTNATSLPVSTGISGLAAGIATWLAGASSANLSAALTDETGSGAAVFGTAPTISAPNLSGLVNLSGAVKYSTQSAPSQITADQNDYNPSSVNCATSTTLLINSDAARNVTGLGGGVAGCQMLLVNNGAFTITLKEQSASSSASNRFNTGGDIALAANAAAAFVYDGGASRWRMASPASAGGGGGTVTSIVCNGGVTTITTSGTCASREVLSGSRTYYVRAAGNDNCAGTTDADGSSGACAFLTIQKAINVVTALDIGTNAVTIQVRSGTFTGSISCSGPWLGSGTVTLVGDNTTPGNVILSTGSSTTLTAQYGCVITVSGFKVTTSSGGANGILAQYGGRISITNKMEYGAVSGQHVRMLDGGSITISSGYTISGAATDHWAVIGSGSQLRAQSVGTITISGTPAFSNFFMQVRQNAAANVSGNTFSGSATGTRYYVDLNGVISTASGGATYLPGNAAGSTATGGQYE